MADDDKDIEDLDNQTDDNLDQETDDSDAAGEQALSAPAVSARPVNPQLDKYQQFMDQYKALQQQRQTGNLVAGLAQAGAQVGQAMAGRYSGNFNPDESGVKLLQQQANQPVSDFEQGQVVQGRGITLQDEAQARDPNSHMSQVYRDYATKRLGMNLSDDVTAFDVQNLLKTVGKPTATHSSQLPLVNKQTGEKIMGIFNPTTAQFLDSAGNVLDGSTWVRDYRAQMGTDPRTGEKFGFSGGTGKATGSITGPGVNAPVVPENPGDETSTEPIQLNRSYLNSQQAKQVDQARKAFINEVKDDRNSLNANDRVINVLEAGGQIGDLPREIQDQLNRAFGQKGHISDAQLGGLLGKADWKNKVANAVSLGSTGKLTDENREFLLQVARLIKDQNEKYIQNKSQVYSNNLYQDLKTAPNLQKYKFGPDAAQNLLSVDSAVHPEGPVPKQDPEIVQYAKDHFKGNYNQAKNVLVKRGYEPQEGNNTKKSTPSPKANQPEQPDDNEEEQ